MDGPAFTHGAFASGGGGAAVVAAGGGDGAESLLCEKIPGIVAVYARVTLGGGGAAVVAAGGGDGARKLVFCVKRSSELWLSMRVSLLEVVELRW